MSGKVDCPFCSPKDRVLKSNKHALVLLSNPRKTAGHFLVMPKPPSFLSKPVPFLSVNRYTIHR
jgi:hypothetical protein